MRILPQMEIALLMLAALGAGFVDAVSGGGGLIQLPALLIAYPSAPLPLLFGTNKFASCFGTSAAALRYARAVAMPWRLLAGSALAAFTCSFLGARCSAHISASVLRPVVVAALFAVLLFTIFRPSIGRVHAPTLSPRAQGIVAALLGAVLGFYDGLIGPGTGSFLLFSFAALLGFDFLHASASAKVINIATNLAALAYFIPTGNVRYELAFGMAVANVTGAYVGVHLSLKRGVGFIRGLFIVVVLALLAKQVQQLLGL